MSTPSLSTIAPVVIKKIETLPNSTILKVTMNKRDNVNVKLIATSKTYLKPDNVNYEKTYNKGNNDVWDIGDPSGQDIADEFYGVYYGETYDIKLKVFDNDTYITDISGFTASDTMITLADLSNVNISSTVLDLGYGKGTLWDCVKNGSDGHTLSIKGDISYIESQKIKWLLGRSYHIELKDEDKVNGNNYLILPRFFLYLKVFVLLILI